MDFHAAMETFAEAWVAANTPTAVNTSDPQMVKPTPLDELPTMLTKEQLIDPRLAQQTHSSPPKPPLKPTAIPHHIAATQHTMTPQSQTTQQQRPPMVTVTGAPQVMPPKHLSNVPIAANVTIAPNEAAPSASGAKSIPIHCVVEQISSLLPTDTPPAEPAVELDTYAIIPGLTLFSEIVRTALIKIGYTATEAMGAKGAIQVKNWKPLTFDSITENPDATVDDILGDLTSLATLRIRMCSQPELDSIVWGNQTVRCAVIELLKEVNQSTLATLSPLSQSTISNIANSKYSAKICPSKCREFGLWYKEYRINHTTVGRIIDAPKDTRVTFHPDVEIPRMREWFQRHKNPTDTALHKFVDELNEGYVRKERPKVTINKLKIWWKNERARLKRLEAKSEEKSEEHAQRQNVAKRFRGQGEDYKNRGEDSSHGDESYHSNRGDHRYQVRGSENRHDLSPDSGNHSYRVRGSESGQDMSPDSNSGVHSNSGIHRYRPRGSESEPDISPDGHSGNHRYRTRGTGSGDDASPGDMLDIAQHVDTAHVHQYPHDTDSLPIHQRAVIVQPSLLDFRVPRVIANDVLLTSYMSQLEDTSGLPHAHE